MKCVEVYWSHQSPYCYFVLDRLLELAARADVALELRLVLPGLLRNAAAFRDRSRTEQEYFLRDTRRTAAFLGLPYGEPRPYPLELQSGSLYRAAANQPRIGRLNHLTLAAAEVDAAWPFLDRVTRLIWDGKTAGWDEGPALGEAIALAGLELADLETRARDAAERYEEILAANHQRLIQAGHWGVPVFVYDGEPFYGQDRFDQLLWRIGMD